MDSVCSHSPSLDPQLCVGGQKTKVTQGTDLGPASEVGGQAAPPSPENSEQIVIRAVKRRQKARGSLKNETQLLAAYTEQWRGGLVALGIRR